MILAESSGLFDTFGGLPLHPLVVHFAVVLLPLSALGLIVIVIRPAWAKTFGWLVMAGLLVGAGAAFVAKETGEALSSHVGLPQEHANYGDKLPLVAVLLFVVALAWFLLIRKTQRRTPATIVLAIISVLLAVAATVLTVVVGHTGAEAAWAGRLTPAPAATAPASSPSSDSAQSGASGYTMADIAQHNTATDCWTAVDGNAYDVTQWIAQHPGGPVVIEGMCGIDGSGAFNGQHGGQARPSNELANFLLGPVQG